MARRKALVAEVTRLREDESNATFADNAMQLLTRWWASTGWNAREELLKAADWLIRVEKQNRQAKSASQLQACGREVLMVNPLEVLPVLLMALAIVLLPLLSDGPPG